MKRIIWETIYLANKESCSFLKQHHGTLNLEKQGSHVHQRYLQHHFGCRFCGKKRLCFLEREPEVLSARLFQSGFR